MCQRRQLSSVQLQNLSFFPFACILCSRIQFIYWNVKQIQLFYPRNPTSIFRNGDVLWPFPKSLPLNFNIHPYANYLSICTKWQWQFPQHLQNKKHLAISVRFCCWLLVAVKWFQIIWCRIGWQLTSDESWNTELVNSRWSGTPGLPRLPCELPTEEVIKANCSLSAP